MSANRATSRRTTPRNVPDTAADSSVALVAGTRGSSPRVVVSPCATSRRPPAACSAARARARTTPPAQEEPLVSERPPRHPAPLDVEQHRRIVRALQANAGNLTAAASALGLHRTQLR